MSKTKKYAYKKYNLTLDIDVLEEKEMSDFLQQNHRKRNNFNDQLKKALKFFMEEYKEKQ